MKLNWKQIEIDWGDRITFSDKYSIKPTNNLKYDELVLIQHFKENKFKSKANVDLIPDYFLYEMDDLSLSEQKIIYEEIEKQNKLKYIKCLTFSGNKSIHCIIPIVEEYKDLCCDRTYYKLLWIKTGEFIFGDYFKFLDMQCSARGKYFRNPNGRRLFEDNKVVVQTCYFFNKKCASLKSIQEKGIIDAKRKIKYHEEKRKISTLCYNKDIEKDLNFLSKIKKETDNIKLCKDVLLYNNYPSGANYVGGFWTLVNMHFSEDVLKRYCDLVSSVHPSNIPTSFWERNKEKIGG